jgi:diguanylate cyclase (GGDEF)-like protein
VLELHALRQTPMRVVLVSRDEELALPLWAALTEHNSSVVRFANLEAAREVMEREVMDGLIVDGGGARSAAEPELAAVCASLRIDPRFEEVSVVVLTPSSDAGATILGAGGADLVLPRDVPVPVLVASIEGAIERVRVRRFRMGRDSVSGLSTTAVVLPEIEARLAASRRVGGRDCVGLVRIADVAQVRARHGQGLLDRAHRRVGALLRSTFRQSDVRGRLHGDAFVLYLPESTEDVLTPTVERLKRDFASLPFTLARGEEVRLALQVGLAGFPRAGLTLPALLSAAYDALA